MELVILVLKILTSVNHQAALRSTESFLKGKTLMQLNYLYFFIYIIYYLYSSLPFEFSEIDLAKNDSAKNQMLIEIETAISNMYGIRSFVSTPYMVFERFIRIQIEMLRQPITICIDMVIEELKMAIQSHTQCVSIILCSFCY